MQPSEVLKKIRPCDMEEPFVFVSYSSLDSQRVWEDVLRFQQLGYNVWLDEKNLDKTKASWRADALEAIRDINCCLLVFYVSRYSLVSKACFAELGSTVEETTQATHNGPVKFVAVDAEPIDDIIQFQQEVYTQVRSNKTFSKEEKTGRLVTLRQCIDQFFDSNNEKVRVKAYGLPNRKMDYYEEIVAAFPDESRIFGNEEAAEPETRKPAPEKKENVPAPVARPRPSEILEMPYDFLEDVRLRFEKNFGKKQNIKKESAEKITPEIPLAQIRRERESYEQSFYIVDTDGYHTLAYLVEDFLIPAEGQWTLSNKLRRLPITEAVGKNGKPQRRITLEGERFTGEDHNVVLLSIHEDRNKALLNSGLLTCNDKLYVSRRPSTVGLEDIDEFGYHRNADMDGLFAFCDIEDTAESDFWQPTCWRRSVSQYKPEYLRYLVLDARSMEEIPKTFSRNSQGEYQLGIVLPCPGRLIVMEATHDGTEFADNSDAVAGYLHGIYGLKKNPTAAERLMREKAEEGDAPMAFEYGAFLRKEGKAQEAEKHLRVAAKEAVDGAKFELAQLLLEKAQTEEVRQLLDELWAKGRRTYGPDISIDLLEEHQESEE